MAAPSGGEQFQLPELPYAKNALEPHTTARTLEVHWGKHHAAYVANLNKAMQAEGGKGYAGMSLDQVVTKSFADQHADGPIFNNAGQARVLLEPLATRSRRAGATRAVSAPLRCRAHLTKPAALSLAALEPQARRAALLVVACFGLTRAGGVLQLLLAVHEAGVDAE